MTANLDVHNGVSDPQLFSLQLQHLYCYEGLGGGDFSPDFLLVQRKLTTHFVLINI